MLPDVDTSWFTSEYVMICAGGTVSLQSRLQKVVALSTTEPEYMAVIDVGKEMIWMKEFVEELGIQQGEFRLYCNNQSGIHLARNVTYHSRTKHIEGDIISSENK